MSQQLAAYFESVKRVRALLALHENLHSTTTRVLDVSDILRSAHVLAASAVDFYVHEIVRVAIVEIYAGSRPVVPGYQRLRVGLGNFSNHGVISEAISNIESDVREQHSYLAFQHPDKIADAIRCVSDSKLWEDVGRALSMSPKDIKDRLKLIVDRRNKIAHEADVDPTYGGRLWPILHSDVLGVLDFLDQIVVAIDQIIDL